MRLVSGFYSSSYTNYKLIKSDEGNFIHLAQYPISKCVSRGLTIWTTYNTFYHPVFNVLVSNQVVKQRAICYSKAYPKFMSGLVREQSKMTGRSHDGVTMGEAVVAYCEVIMQRVAGSGRRSRSLWRDVIHSDSDMTAC